jgi:hypothetical protein
MVAISEGILDDISNILNYFGGHMKKILLGIFLTASLNAVAAPVYLYPSCSYTATSAQCTLMNTSGKDINCNIQVTARTQKFRMINGYTTKFMYSGMMEWVNIYNYDYNDPITNVQGSANCSTMN